NTKLANIQAVISGTGELDLQLQNSSGNNLYMGEGYSEFFGGRLQVRPPASTNAGLYVEVVTAHTGNLLRLVRGVDEKLRVDTNGNIVAVGSVTAGNLDSGTANAVLNAAASVDITVTFAKTFPTVPRVMATLRGNPTLPAGSSALTVRALNITTTGCQLRVNDVAGVARTLTHAVDWIALS
ncbi:MAG: H-type lectin domain-containing protein, partial [Streptomyces sp.]|nr:H-type lectin domain-containing protein [Streptomyces sp.]